MNRTLLFTLTLGIGSLLLSCQRTEQAHDVVYNDTDDTLYVLRRGFSNAAGLSDLVIAPGDRGLVHVSRDNDLETSKQCPYRTPEMEDRISFVWRDDTAAYEEVYTQLSWESDVQERGQGRGERMRCTAVFTGW